ncbi:MAG: ankyrin, partial [Burkholderia sp.]|nr:ankyrin [Burkholderia sp.]
MDVGIATSALGAFSTVKPLGLPRILVDGETQAPGVGTVQLRPLAMPTWRIPSAVFSASHTAPYFVSANVCASARLLLHEAARNGDASTVRHMLASGSGDIRMIDPVTGYSALMLAAQHGHAEVVSALCEKSFTVDMHRQDAQGNTALMLAAMAGDAAIVALLGQLGANAYQEDNKGNTALMKIAACGARIDIARLLVDLGADPTHRNHAGKTAADLATMEGDLLTAAALAGMAAEAARGTINGLLSKLNSNTAAKAMVTDKVMASTYGMPPATAPV